jgi:hypothetical protein
MTAIDVSHDKCLISSQNQDGSLVSVGDNSGGLNFPPSIRTKMQFNTIKSLPSIKSVFAAPRICPQASSMQPSIAPDLVS